jgi:hypothetical protein
MVSKKSSKKFTVDRPKRKPNKEALNVKDTLTNEEVMQRCSFNRQEKADFKAFKTGKGKWKVYIAGLNENNGWQRYIVTKNDWIFSWSEGMLNDRYVVLHRMNKKKPKPPKVKPKESLVGKTPEEIEKILKKENAKRTPKKKASKKKKTQKVKKD